MAHPKISVIVTVHNAEDTLKACLDSVCAQTLKEIEILCMDGGSSDGSPEILKEYRQKDARIRVIDDKNTSYGHKINAGVEQAKGEYISILESDDCMKPHMLEALYEIVKERHPDFVDSDYDGIYYVNGRRCVWPVSKYSDPDCYDAPVDQSDCLRLLREAAGAIWTGLYRAAFLRVHHIRMFESPGAAFQDTSFRFLVNMSAKSSYHIRERLYCYRMDYINSSIRDQKKIFAIHEEYRYLKKELEKRDVAPEVWNAYYRWKYSSYFWNAFRLEETVRKEFLDLYRKELEQDAEKGCIRRENQEQADYMNTFLMLDDGEAFQKRIIEQAERGNLNINYLAGIICDLQGCQAVICGYGARGSQALKILENADIKINGICDNSSERRQMAGNGYEILPVEDAVKAYRDSVFVVASEKYFEEMKSQLCGLGVSKEKIYHPRL